MQRHADLLLRLSGRIVRGCSNEADPISAGPMTLPRGALRRVGRS